jgi:hypothetical protein
MRSIQQHKVLTPFLTTPHKTRKNERLPEYNALFLFTKLTLLTLAYEIAAEEYSMQFSWMDCCREAVDRMQRTGQPGFHPRAVMRWNQDFRTAETFPHLFERQKALQGMASRNY